MIWMPAVKMPNRASKQRRLELTAVESGDPERLSEVQRYASLLRTELDRFVTALKAIGAQKIVLFGSYAQGREDLYTDLDLFVVLDSDLAFVPRTAWLYQQLAPRVACDILAYTPKEWAVMQDRAFVRDALRKGDVLYEEERK